MFEIEWFINLVDRALFRLVLENPNSYAETNRGIFFQPPSDKTKRLFMEYFDDMINEKTIIIKSCHPQENWRSFKNHNLTNYCSSINGHSMSVEMDRYIASGVFCKSMEVDNVDVHDIFKVIKKLNQFTFSSDYTSRYIQDGNNNSDIPSNLIIPKFIINRIKLEIPKNVILK